MPLRVGGPDLKNIFWLKIKKCRKFIISESGDDPPGPPPPHTYTPLPGPAAPPQKGVPIYWGAKGSK